MQRSDLLIKIASFIAFLAMAIYIGYYLYNSRSDPLKTAPAIMASVEESVDADGYAVRDEHVITGGGLGAYITASDGEKVSASGTVAVVYSSDTAVERSEQMKKAQLELNALSGLLGGRTASDIAAETVMEAAYAVRGGDLSDMAEIGAKVDTYIFSDKITYTAEQLKSEISGLQAQLDQFAAAASSDTRSVTAGEAGVFSSVVDGFESISPNELTEMDHTKYVNTFNSPGSVASDTVGKIITGLKWYFVTELPSGSAERLADMNRVTVRFSKTYTGSVEMDIERIGEEENGACVVVFSSDKYLHELSQVRALYGDVIFSSTTGLRVPKEALYTDEEGADFIYMIVGLQAERADVEILGEDEGFYIVRPADGARLHEGDEIVISAGDIYDGKVKE